MGILQYCNDLGIKAFRVSSDLFPLSTHALYRDKALNVIDRVLQKFNGYDFHNIHLSQHPDQFILLSSLNQNVNEQSIYDLNLSSYISQKIPFRLINIHVGSKNQGEIIHRDIFKKNIEKLEPLTKKLLSIENDEKSYSFSSVLSIAEENRLMMVSDFHHERCFQRRNNPGISFQEIDENVYQNMDRILKTYQGKKSLPLFHLSSPLGGWCGKFKEECSHADYIDPNDYPALLEKYSDEYGTDFILVCRFIKTLTNYRKCFFFNNIQHF